VEEPEETDGAPVATAPRRLAAEEVAHADFSTRTILVRNGPGVFDHEVRIRSHKVACLVAAVIGVAIGVVTILWFENAWTWLDPCRDTPASKICDEPTAWFRVPQFVIASVGLVTGATISVYLLRFAFMGQIWRNSRRIAIAHGLVVVVWLFVWAFGSFAR
jgi:hypothetical protein